MEAAQAELDAPQQSVWGQRILAVAAAWRRGWGQVIPFFAVSLEVSRVIHTTNAFVSVHVWLRKIIQNRGSSPSDEAVTTLIWLTSRSTAAVWTRTSRRWKSVMNQLGVLFGGRFTLASR